MRKNKRTIKLAEIRRLIRKACYYYAADEGIPTSWTSKNYQKARAVKRDKNYVPIKKDCPYYTRSSRAIEEIAEKILKIAEKR